MRSVMLLLRLRDEEITNEHDRVTLGSHFPMKAKKVIFLIEHWKT